MSLAVFLAMILAAFLHAASNAIVKGGKRVMAIGGGASSVACTLVVWARSSRPC